MPTVTDLRDRVKGWFHREPKVIVPRRIMVLDGNAGKRDSTARLVESLGYEVLKAQSVAEALAQLEEVQPEFVLLGFDLADATGLEALAQLREVDADLPVAMLAADLWDARVAEAMRKGAVAYLAPPFGQDDLRELLGRR